MINVLIADDESLARETVKLLLKNRKGIGHVFEADNGNDVIKLCQENKIDLVFLDIQMPGKTGIEVAELLPSNTVVVFATAYDQYAIMAFELNAIGYLLKPFDDEKFYSALTRAEQQIDSNIATDVSQVKQLIAEMKADSDSLYRSRLVIKDPGKIRLIDVKQIDYITGAGNYAELHLDDGKTLLHRATLSSLEQLLDPQIFIRIHRSTIVKKALICELQPNEGGDYSVLLKNGQQLVLSRRNKDKLDILLSS